MQNQTDLMVPRPRGNPAMVRGGPSLNPGGRPAGVTGRTRELILGETHDLRLVIDYLVGTLRDVNATHRDRTAAAGLLLDRALGKAPAALEITARAESVRLIPANWDQLTDGERGRIIAQLEAGQ